MQDQSWQKVSLVQVVINSNAPYQKAQRNPGLLVVCSVLPGKHPDPSARGQQGTEAMTCLELDLHYNSRMSNVCGHVQVHENVYLWWGFHYVIGCKWFLNVCFECFFFLLSALKCLLFSILDIKPWQLGVLGALGPVFSLMWGRSTVCLPALQ